MQPGSTKQNAGLIVVFLLLCSLHLWGYAHLPKARTQSDGAYASIVLHNWHEYGYWHQHGQLVANPGGLNAGEKPFIYPGHRPYLLLVPYWFRELPGAAGGNGLLYDFVMVMVTFAGAISLFGTGARGILLAFIICLCPGFIYSLISIDLTSFPELLGLAVLPFVAGRLADSSGKQAGRVLALVVMVLFMLLNWSTVFSLFVMAVYLGARRPEQWKKLAIFLGIAAAVGLAVVAISLVSRHQPGQGFGHFWNAYLWGPLGYDLNGMTLGKAIVRISAVSVIAWLPLAAGGVVLWFRNGSGERWRWSPLPLVAAIIMVLVIRNHSAHHPWVATCIIGLGLLFSLELLIAPRPVSRPAFSSMGIAMAAAFALVYCAGWTALDEFNTRTYNSLYALVAQNTPRHSFIVVTDSLTEDGKMDPETLSIQVDRKVLSAGDWESQKDDIARSGTKVFFLTHGNLPPGARPVAESQCQAKWTDRFFTPLFDFYRNKISRRAQGDRKVYFEEYRLYEL
jgi:hypothetical protein